MQEAVGQGGCGQACWCCGDAAATGKGLQGRAAGTSRLGALEGWLEVPPCLHERGRWHLEHSVEKAGVCNMITVYSGILCALF